MTEQIDVFISYKREERNLAERLLVALQRNGYSVVTDLDIASSEPFGDAIDQMIRNARLVVVLWTKASASSKWVRLEAEESYDQGKYLGVMLDDLEPAALPALVRRVQYLDVRSLDFTQALSEILHEVTSKIGPAIQTEQSATTASQLAQREYAAFNGAVLMDSLLAWKAFLTEFPKSTFAPAVEAKIKNLESRWNRWVPSYKFLSLILAVIGTTLGAMKYFDYPPSTTSGAELASLASRLADTEAILNKEQEANKAVVAEIALLEKTLNGNDMALTQERKNSQVLEAQITNLNSQIEILVKETDAFREQSAANFAKYEQAQWLADDYLSQSEAMRDELARQNDEIQGMIAAQKALEVKETRLRALVSEKDAALLATSIALKQAEEKFLKQIAQIPKSNCKVEGQEGIKILGECIKLTATNLDLTGEDISNLAPIAALRELQTLYLRSTQVVDLSPLAGLAALQKLSLSNTQVADLSPLVGLTALQTLYLYDSQVVDLSPLAGMTALQTLDLAYTQVADLSPIAELSALQTIYLNNTQVADLSPLAGLIELDTLFLNGVNANSFETLKKLKKLSWLQMPNTEQIGSILRSSKDNKEVQAFLKTL